MAYGTVLLGQLVGSLLIGDDKGSGQIIERMGKNAILQMLGGPSSTLSVAFNALLRAQGAAARASAKEAIAEAVEEKVVNRVNRRKYAQAHQDWLNSNRWRFDWRSQPRRPAGTEAGGEWMEGRLDYPIATKATVSRSERRRRTRAIKAYKSRAPSHSRTIRTSWGDY
jgi:hypothetical protein